MRFVLLLAAAVSAAGMAVAQSTQRVTIEDDVSRENAVKCTALRTLHLQEDRKVRGSLLISAALLQTAWQDYLVTQAHYGDPGKSRADVQAMADRFQRDPAFAQNPLAFVTELAAECEPFEIRSAPPAGG